MKLIMSSASAYLPVCNNDSDTDLIHMLQEQGTQRYIVNELLLLICYTHPCLREMHEMERAEEKGVSGRYWMLTSVENKPSWPWFLKRH